MLTQILDEYLTRHTTNPTEILVTPHAALTLAAKGTRLTNWCRTVPIRCDLLDGSDAVAPGTGSRLGLFVKDNGIQQYVAAVELR